MSVGLADVNVLIALFDPDHIHHEVAHHWLGSLGKQKWSTCPLSENGCVRILGQSAYTGRKYTATEGSRLMHSLLDRSDHEFWSDSVSLLDASRFNLEAIEGSRQITDVYLMGLAVQHNGHLVTFDQSIPWNAVIGAKQSDLLVLKR